MCSFLALLLARDNSETTSSFWLLDRTLLGYLAPSTTRRGTGGRETIADTSVGILNDSLLGKLAAAEELLGETTTIHKLSGRVNTVSNDGWLSWENEEGRDEFINCES